MATTHARRLTLRAAAVVFSFLLLMLLIPVTANAAPSYEIYKGRLDITGEFESRQFTLDSSDTDLFNLKNIGPGAIWEGEIVVHNDCDSTIEFALLTIRSDIPDTLLYEELDLEITAFPKGQHPWGYTGSYDTSGFDQDPLLGYCTIAPGEEFVMNVKVQLPANAGNEFQGREMKSIWTFEARHPSVNDDVQTGFDLTASNTLIPVWLLVAILAALGAVVTYLRVRRELKRQDRS